MNPANDAQFRTARQQVMADDPESFREHADRCFARVELLAAAVAELRGALDLVGAHLKLKAVGPYADALLACIDRVNHLADVEAHNGRVWSTIADVLAEAQQDMRRLDAAPSAVQAGQIANRLNNAYLVYLTKLVSPEPLAMTGRPAPKQAPRQRANPDGEPPPEEHQVANGVRIPGLPAVAWSLGAGAAATATPRPGKLEPGRADTDRTVVVEPVVVTPAHQPPAAAVPPGPSTPVRDAPVLLDRDHVAHVLAAAAITRHHGNGLITVRGDDGETAPMLAAILRHARGLSRSVVGGSVTPLRLDAAWRRRASDVWAALGTALARAAPHPRGKRWGRRSPSPAGQDAVLGALAALREAGTVPVVLVDDLRWTGPATADELIGVLTALAEGEPALSAVVALDPAVLAEHLDRLPGRPPGYGASRVRRLDRFGVDVPPPSAADFDPALLAMRRDTRYGSPRPVWAAAERLADAPWIADLVRAHLSARPERVRDPESLLWLWRFYLNVLTTGALSPTDAGQHALTVLAAAEVAFRWRDLRLTAVPFGTRPDLRALVAARDDDRRWERTLAAQGLVGDRGTAAALRGLLVADDAVAMLVAQLF